MKKTLLISLIAIWFIQDARSQQRVTGTVLDASAGEPLPGVSILIKNTSSGTSSDMDGNFTLENLSDDAVLIFSFIGYESREVVVGGKSNITVQLEQTYETLSEVVVVGYGTQKKSDLTGSVAGVDQEALTRNKTVDVLSAMQGKIAGVQIASESGELGSGMNITIRGANTIYGSSTPLFVIDGVQMDINSNEVAGAKLGSTSGSNPLANLNPSDIESIEVLKDASATAIYGSRGANGVVIVTTKAGKDSNTVISYDGWASFSRPLSTLDVLNGPEFLEYQQEIDPAGIMVNEDTDGDGILDSPRDFSGIRSHDWQDQVYRTAFTQNHNISVTGGNKATRFSGGLGFLGQEGIVRNNTQDRYTVRLRVDHQQSKRLKVGLNLNTSYNELNGISGSGGGGASHGIIQRIAFTRPVEIFDPLNDIEGDFISPLTLVKTGYRNTTLFKSILSSYLDYEIVKGLKFNVTASGTLTDSKGKEFYGKETPWGRQPQGYAAVTTRNTNSWLVTSLLQYDKKLNDNHRIAVMAGYEINSYNFESADMEAGNFEDESTGVDDISKGSTILGYNTSRWKNNRLSYFGRANYNFLDRYLFTVTFRADGSDKFGADNRWGYFPSAAFAWRVSDEAFMKGQEVVSNLKARLSYGETGNERIPAYRYLANMENASYGAGGPAKLGLVPSSMANPELKWETTVQYNAGIDFNLLNDRFQITADYYVKETVGMLLPVLVPSHLGFREQWQNRGRVDNRGVELSLQSYNVRAGDFEWNTSFNISFNKNKILSLGDVESIPVNIVQGDINNLGIIMTGQPIGTGYGYLFDGIYQIDDFTWQSDSDPSIAHGDRTYVLKDGVVQVGGVNPQPGSHKFLDLNGDGVVNDEHDRRVISNSQPKHFGGINNTFRYKGFDLNVFMDWSFGREILNHSELSLQGVKKDNLSRDFYYNRWTPENPSEKYGTYRAWNVTGLMNSTAYVEDGSFMRLRSVTLGYSLPRQVFSKIGFTNMRIYVSGNNLYTWTRYSGLDPEVNFNNSLLTGLDKVSYPRTKDLIVGINASF